MSDAELARLEAEVIEARRRVAAGLDRITPKSAFAELRDNVAGEIGNAKDQVVAKAKASATDAASGIIEELKARVAANPAAALVIGAGIAWRLYRHPPVTTLLVGAGVASLLRTDPRYSGAAAEGVRRARHMLEDAKASLEEWSQGTLSGNPGVRAEPVANNLVGATQHAARLAGDMGNAGSRRVRRGVRSVDRAIRRAETNDKVLLGAAAVAVAAAVGLAYRRGRD